MEPLVEIPRENWAVLRDLYRSNWPGGAEAYCLLNIQIAHPTLAQEFDFHVYCPEGNLSNGMIATSLQNDYYQVMIQPIGENIAKIEESLLTTNILNWNRMVMVPFANAATIDCLERIKRKLGLNLFYNSETKAYKHFLDKGSKKFDDLTIPPNTYIGSLRPEHISIVDKTWSYHSDSSHKLFETLMKTGLSYVLYSKNETGADNIRIGTCSQRTEEGNAEDDNHKEKSEKEIVTPEENEDAVIADQETNKESESKNMESRKGDSDEPLAWLSVSESGALSHLFCSEKHRKKGYAEVITKYVANELLSKGHDLIAYTTETNVNPKNLFRKLGFKDVGHNHYVMVKKIV